MAMEFPDNLADLGVAVQNFMMMRGGNLPENLRSAMLTALGAPSPVERVVKTGELLYGSRDIINDEAKALCAQLISFAAMQGWNGLNDDNRGGRIVQAMRRELGEKAPNGRWPKVPNDPERLPEITQALGLDAEDEINPTI